MAEIAIAYESDGVCTAAHGPSGEWVGTDANPGPGLNSFAPGDLLAAALGTSMLTSMGIAARQRGIDLRGAVATVRSDDAAGPHRRLGWVSIEFRLPVVLPDEQRAALEWAARSSQVHRSLHPDVDVALGFSWGAGQRPANRSHNLNRAGDGTAQLAA